MLYEPKDRRFLDLNKLPFDRERLRIFLRIPYLYKVPDDFDPDVTDWQSDPAYKQDVAVDNELQKIASQAAGVVFTRTGICIKDTKYIYRFKGTCEGVVKIVPSPTYAVESFTIDGVRHGITFERDKDYQVNLGTNSFKEATLEFLCGFNVAETTRYRSGDNLNVAEGAGVPYPYYTPTYTLPDSLVRLWEVLIDHFYQHRGIVQVGTIVAKMPTSLDALVASVLGLVPHDLYPTPDALTFE